MSLYQNKFQNAYINTTTNSSYLISSTYQSDNSLVNKGKSEFENNVVFDQRVAIGKAIDGVYALDVLGNVRINGGQVPVLTDDLVFLGNLQATKPVGIGKVYNAAYSLDISGNVRITNGNLTGGGVVAVSNENTFTANQTFLNPVGFGKTWDSAYPLDVSGNIRISDSIIGGNVASIKTDNAYDGKQSFLSQVGIRKTWDNAYSLDISGNVRISNGVLTGGNVAILTAQNTFTDRNRFNAALTINRAYDGFANAQLDVSGNFRVSNGTSTFNGNVSLAGAIATVSQNPINDSGIVNRGYANTNYGRLANNNIWTATNAFTGTDNYFSYPVSCLADPTDTNHLVRKGWIDANTIDYATANIVYSGMNVFDVLPTSLVTPTIPEQIVTKAYVDSVTVTGASLTATQTFTGTNTFDGQVIFNNYIPSCDINATGNYDLVNKSYIDTYVLYHLLSNNNTWTNFNTFQEDIGIQGNNANFSTTTNTSFSGPTTFANPPTCSVDPSGVSDLTRKYYVDLQVSNLLGAPNQWNNVNTFMEGLDISGIDTFLTVGPNSQFISYGGCLFNGIVQFDSLPTCSLEPINGIDLANKGYVDERSLRTVDDVSRNYAFQTNLGSLTSSGVRNSAFGFEAGDSTTSGSNNTYLGYRAGATFITSGSYNVFLGANSGSFGNYSNSVAIGANVTVTGNNQIRIGDATHTTLIRGNIDLRGQALYSVLDVSTNITIGTSGYVDNQFYAVDISGNITVNFISSASTQMGQTATFRRVGGNTSAQVLSTSSNIYPLNSMTATNVVLDASENLVRITRLRNSAGTGGWYKM